MAAPRPAARRRVRPRRRAARRARGPGHRLRGRQVGADRAEDRRDAHLHRHAGQLPAPGGQPARRPRHRGQRGRRDRAQQERRDRATSTACSRRSSGWACPIIAITGEPSSFLGRVGRGVLDACVSEEACPHDLAPTVEHHRGAGAGRRARGGAAGGEGVPPRGLRRAPSRAARSGRRLLLRVRDVMLPPQGLVSAGDADARGHRAAGAAPGHRHREPATATCWGLHRRRPDPAGRAGARLLRLAGASRS